MGTTADAQASERLVPHPPLVNVRRYWTRPDMLFVGTACPYAREGSNSA